MCVSVVFFGKNQFKSQFSCTFFDCLFRREEREEIESLREGVYREKTEILTLSVQ